MGKYYAVIGFNTLDFEADSDDEAESRVQDLIDKLGSLDSEFTIDNADYTIYVEGEGH